MTKKISTIGYNARLKSMQDRYEYENQNEYENDAWYLQEELEASGLSDEEIWDGFDF